MVRLKGTYKSKFLNTTVFQFLMVRLKAMLGMPPAGNIAFQFLMVRLKAASYKYGYYISILISIPYGAIKSIHMDVNIQKII